MQQREWDLEFEHLETKERRWFHNIAIGSEVEGRTKYILVMSDRTADKQVNQALSDAVYGIFQNAAAVVPQVKHQTGRTVCGQGTQGVVQLAGGGAVELTDADIAHIVQQLVVHGSAGVARMGQLGRFGSQVGSVQTSFGCKE